MNLLAAVTPSPTPSVGGSAQHDAFDWWANIWLPAMTGALTLILTGVSLWVAWQAFKTAKRATDLELTKTFREERAKRAELGHLMKRWYLDALAARVKPTSLAEKRLLAGQAEEISRMVATSSTDSAEHLERWLRSHLDAKTDAEVVQIGLEGWEVIDEWVDEPGAIVVKTRNEALQRAIQRKADSGPDMNHASA